MSVCINIVGQYKCIVAIIQICPASLHTPSSLVLWSCPLSLDWKTVLSHYLAGMTTHAKLTQFRMAVFLVPVSTLHIFHKCQSLMYPLPHPLPLPPHPLLPLPPPPTFSYPPRLPLIFLPPHPLSHLTDNTLSPISQKTPPFPSHRRHPLSHLTEDTLSPISQTTHSLTWGWYQGRIPPAHWGNLPEPERVAGQAHPHCS